MKLDFVKNTKRNLAAHLVNTGVKTVIPFFRKTLFMWVLGSEYLGLNGLFYSILGMLSLAEMGLGSAMISYMYKPIAEDNHKLLCAYYKLYRTLYMIVGSFIFIAGLCLLPFLRYFIHGNIPPDVNMYILYLMFLTNTALGYLLFAYRGSLFYAYHRNDIVSYISTFWAVAEFIAVCIVLYVTHNYYHYVLVLLVENLCFNITVMIASKKCYPNVIPHGDLPKDELKHIIKDSTALFMHKIGAVVSNFFDNVVISSFLGLSPVAAYNNYNHIKTSVAGISGSVCTSMLGGFGNKIHTESKEENFKLLMKANSLIICIIIWCAAVLLALYQPFMHLWTMNDPTLLRHFMTPLLMVIWFYEKQSRETLRTFKNAAAIWQRDRWKAVLASLANLSLNLLFIHVLPNGYKLDGVILATIITDVVIQMPWESYAVFSTFFSKEQSRHYWNRQIFYFVFSILVCILTWCVVRVIPLEGLLGLAVKGIVAAAVAAAILSTVFYNIMLLALEKLLAKVK